MTDALIHFPIYIGDALKKFIEYPTLKERGAWLSLCVALIQHDGRLNDDDSLYYKCMCFNDEDKQVLKQIISKCLSKTNGVYMCKEITALINKQKTLRDKRAEAGRKGGLKSRKDKQSLSKTKAKSKHSELETELEPNLDLESEQHNKPSYKMFDPGRTFLSFFQDRSAYLLHNLFGRKLLEALFPCEHKEAPYLFGPNIVPPQFV